MLQYRPLFSVEMLHDYYLSEDADLYEQDDKLRQQVLAIQRQNYQLSSDLTISPTADCAQILRNNRLLFKETKRGFFVAAQVLPATNNPNGPFKPFLSFDKLLQLRFVVTVSNAYFYNMTNLRLESDSSSDNKYLYLFSNLNQNIAVHPTEGDLLYLSAKTESFNPNYAYKAGEIIIENLADMHEAIEDNGPSLALDSSKWTKIYQGQNPHFEFVSAASRIALRPSIFRHTVRTTTKKYKSVVIVLRNRDNLLIDRFLFEAKDPQDPTATLDTCLLEFGHLTSGVYSLQVQELDGTPISDLDLKFYLDDALYRQGALAVIECFHNPDGSLAKYRWLDNNNQLLQPIYRIRWKNRSSWWRYYYTKSPTFTAASSDVNHLDADATKPNHRILITPSPLALTQVTRKISLMVGEGVESLPNPSIESIFPENGKIFSEINMGGGLGPPAP
jgi:hypothetical protein